MKKIIKKAREWALEETKQNGTPLNEHFNISNAKGQELAGKLGANRDIVLIGTMLMDIKLGECLKEDKLNEHIKRSAEATKKFLEQFDLDKETKNKIINCVDGHHGTNKWICKEAEICANADCYRFLHPCGVFAYFGLLGTRTKNCQESLSYVEDKLNEKWNVLSLDICKEELKPYYQMFKELFKKAKE
tara:strand:- start:1140 stop:1706 length:567 start_codon:yes stop_codon:yes gene_type:complete